MTSREDWQRRLGPLYGAAVALVHSTPLPWPAEVADDARSPAWLVAIGVPVGLAAWATAALARAAGLPLTVAALLGLAMLSVASAAIIERGVAAQVDRWDGRPQSAAAVLAVVLTTLVRAFAVLALTATTWPWVFVAAAVSGRWAAVFLQGLGDPIERDDGGRSLVTPPAPMWLIGAISLAVAVLVVLALGKAGIVAVALIAVAAFALGVSAQRRDGGLSAPVVAVVAGLGELLVLLVASSGH